MLFEPRYMDQVISGIQAEGLLVRWRTKKNAGIHHSFCIPDFTDNEGIQFTGISVVVEMDSDIRDTVKPADALQRPLTDRQ